MPLDFAAEYRRHTLLRCRHDITIRLPLLLLIISPCRFRMLIFTPYVFHTMLTLITPAALRFTRHDAAHAVMLPLP